MERQHTFMRVGRLGRQTIVLALGLVTGLLVGIAAQASMASSSQSQGQVVVEFPRNESGETYGSEMDLTSVDQIPDLVLVVADEGIDGYVRKTDLYPPTPSSPQEAIRIQQEEDLRRPRTLPVFDADGKTRIGSFSFGSESPITSK